MTITRVIATATLIGIAGLGLAGCGNKGTDDANTCRQWMAHRSADTATTEQIIGDAQPGPVRDAMVRWLAAWNGHDSTYNATITIGDLCQAAGVK